MSIELDRMFAPGTKPAARPSLLARARRAAAAWGKSTAFDLRLSASFAADRLLSACFTAANPWPDDWSPQRCRAADSDDPRPTMPLP